MSTETKILANCPIQLSEGAINELKNLMYEKELPENYGLRIGVKGGGCSGMSYILGFDKVEEADDIYQVDDIKVYINKAHLLYLAGMEVDYHNGLQNRGFVFNNPNAESTCGCGDSFSA